MSPLLGSSYSMFDYAGVVKPQLAHPPTHLSSRPLSTASELSKIVSRLSYDFPSDCVPSTAQSDLLHASWMIPCRHPRSSAWDNLQLRGSWRQQSHSCLPLEGSFAKLPVLFSSLGRLMKAEPVGKLRKGRELMFGFFLNNSVIKSCTDHRPCLSLNSKVSVDP